ncbi:MAG: pentapeptide repeat-containing protein [Acidimicrobiia bacterium]|nr:pentapeptide repeat-containing protein [Acidimicrobiia bacterium]
MGRSRSSETPGSVGASAAATEDGQAALDQRHELPTRLIGADLSGRDLSGIDLTGHDLSAADLSEARLVGARLDRATLYRAKLIGAQFTGASLVGADLSQAEAGQAGFGGSDLSGASLVGTDLRNATLSGATAVDADLRGAALDDARLWETVFTDADLTRATATGADLTDAVVTGATLTDTDLSGAHLRRIRGYDTATWIGTNTVGVDFSGAYTARRVIIDQNYLHEFRTRDRKHRVLYELWRLTSGCGQSATRWGGLIAIVAVLFALAYTQVEVDYGSHETALSPLYFSVVTLTTLGFGDVLPASWPAQALVIAEVIIGYGMLSGLLSIFATRMGRRAD